MKNHHAGKVLVLALLGLFMLSACSADTASEETTAPVPDATELMPVLSEEAGDADRLPEGFETSEAYTAEALRMLAQSSYGDHFVAEGVNGELCLITVAAPKEQGMEPEVAASTCPPVEHVAENGILLAVTGGESSFDVVTFLLPPDISEQTATETINKLVPNNHTDLRPAVEILSNDSAVLLVMTSETSQELGDFQLPRPNGDSLTIRPLD
ncbi:hypothetical protein CQ010_11525 [Arthrobacter sp. MYb211]|uniref:hypothetical protein n=1 Tax=Micrococcaceae TaxID=1268 RepID=UPI000BB7CCA3|nr:MULTISPECIES: hypothetical protein [Micrococcaceae]PCC27160.1 hypothetical protein CIK76_18220 [Glutamicibacter sp. BW80]PRA00878.1 hypothetical protein CQ019_15195 [Arthrobacter sp. MYb229]PRA10825.1 hypothetical protein CQ015_12235 [Arthrobacter sp. MYb221]PRB48812.1 hypothetical protein CQ013_14600 [Arthrobacter sp. MYb216]PRC06885.1 hypothetical protein CQ010_11525 [Arthrobacter sp. MYb211]